MSQIGLYAVQTFYCIYKATGTRFNIFPTGLKTMTKECKYESEIN